MPLFATLMKYDEIAKLSNEINSFYSPNKIILALSADIDILGTVVYGWFSLSLGKIGATNSISLTLPN